MLQANLAEDALPAAAACEPQAGTADQEPRVSTCSQEEEAAGQTGAAAGGLHDEGEMDD